MKLKGEGTKEKREEDKDVQVSRFLSSLYTSILIFESYKIS